MKEQSKVTKNDSIEQKEKKQSHKDIEPEREPETPQNEKNTNY
ncbi:3-methyladenine DNA glycosylase [Mesobacillus harenae]|nr:3-methyladenine DNA glycosylase [Mesobacillus harenae]